MHMYGGHISFACFLKKHHTSTVNLLEMSCRKLKSLAGYVFSDNQ